MTIKTRTFKKNIEGFTFTFKCVRTGYKGLDNKSFFSTSWYYGADILNCMEPAIGGTHSIKTGIKYQVKAAQMQEIINNR